MEKPVININIKNLVENIVISDAKPINHLEIEQTVSEILLNAVTSVSNMETTTCRHVTSNAIIELKFNEKSPEDVLKIIAAELYKDSRHRRFFGQFSGILKSEPIATSAENPEKPYDASLQ